MPRLSKISSQIDGQPMFKTLDKVKKLENAGKKVIHFEIGDPDFETPQNIIDAATSAFNDGLTHYTSSYGMMEFRKLISETTEQTRGFKPEIEQILITPGANISIFYAITCLVDPGYEVIIPDPGFPTYNSAIKMCKTTAVPIELKESNFFKMDPNDIEKKITEKTKLIIINSPQNPTGSIMTKEEIKHTYEIAEKHDLYLYSDEVYDRMIYDETKFFSPSLFDKSKKHTIVANSFSKTFSMTGWRLGTVIGPENIIERMATLLETTSSCVPAFIQKAGMEAITGDQTNVQKMYVELQKRRDILVEGLNSIRGISCLSPPGAFYVFANIKETGMTSEEFSNYILDDALVAVLPGTDFGIFGEGYIRLCYATNQNNILDALKRIKASIDKL
jgi:aspartate aminotransferase